MASCRRRLAIGSATAAERARAQRAVAAEHAIWLAILRAEREELYRLRAAGRIGDAVLQARLHRIDLAEVALADAAPVSAASAAAP